jgi:hypothetical protein
MASQMFGVTGNRRLKRNQKAELNTRLAMFPDILAAEQAASQQKKEAEFKERELKQTKDIARDELKFKRQQSKAAFGLEVGKTAVNLATSDFMTGKFGGMTLGQAGSGIRNFFGGGAKTAQNPDPGVSTAMQRHGSIAPGSGSTMMGKVGGYFSNIPIGSIAAGGLTGFGIGSMFGDMGKGKKMLYGGLAGAGLGLLGGGLSGALGGGIGGLFGGMIG